jgi:hypothetical protein
MTAGQSSVTPAITRALDSSISVASDDSGDKGYVEATDLTSMDVEEKPRPTISIAGRTLTTSGCSCVLCEGREACGGTS